MYWARSPFFGGMAGGLVLQTISLMQIRTFQNNLLKIPLLGEAKVEIRLAIKFQWNLEK